MRRGPLAVLILLLASSCAQPRPPGPQVPPDAVPPAISLLGDRPLVIPFGCRVGGLRAGGLSGIARTADGSWLAVVDNYGDTPARIFRLGFAIGPQGIAPLAGRSGCGVVTGAIRLPGLDGKNFDGEGIAIEPDGGILVSSETEPSIRELSPTGEIRATLPVPPFFLRAEGKGIRNNQGFESLTLEPGGNGLWTANERALQQDAPDDEARPSPIRLLRYERRGGGFVPTAQYVYEVDPIVPPPPDKVFAVRGVAEMLALPEGGLLALERQYVEGRGMAIQLFHVEIDGATDVSGLESLAGQAWTPVRKTLVYDFAHAGFTPDNLEGMALGPRLVDGSRGLVVISDDNFKAIEQTQLVVLRLPVFKEAR